MRPAALGPSPLRVEHRGALAKVEANFTPRILRSGELKAKSAATPRSGYEMEQVLPAIRRADDRDTQHRGLMRLTELMAAALCLYAASLRMPAAHKPS
jgi:hypothetical protein